MTRWIVSGRVQGVGFRWFVSREARALGVVGWARNLPDGRVEVVAWATSEAISALETALRAGPPMSQVSNVEKTEISDEVASPKSFEIR